MTACKPGAAPRTRPDDLVVHRSTDSLEGFACDRTDWDKGPWDQEPDSFRFKTEAGLHAIALRHRRYGHWCGYVAFDRDRLNAILDTLHVCDDPDRADFCVSIVDHLHPHGGITYGPASCGGHICHVPDPGEGDVLWVGFDCGHAFDVQPHPISPEVAASFAAQCVHYGTPMTYKNLSFVREQCEELARQMVGLFRIQKAVKRAR